jgi:DNA-directed RNA polymerase subunit RPC12/RpoP
MKQTRLVDECGSDTPSESQSSVTERRYICVACKSIVRARWSGTASFHIGCDCTTVPVVPQMGQDETPNIWRVEREKCCTNAEVTDLETCYDEFADYKCPECGATYSWDGEMVKGPNTC